VHDRRVTVDADHDMHVPGGGERYAAYGTDFHAVHFYRRSFGEAQTAATVYFIPDAIASDR
jgi:hypothetical protein